MRPEVRKSASGAGRDASRRGGGRLSAAAVALTALGWIVILAALFQDATAVAAKSHHCEQAEESSGKHRGSDHDCRPKETSTPEPATPSPEPEPATATPEPPTATAEPATETPEPETFLIEDPATSTPAPTLTATPMPTATPEPIVEAAVLAPVDEPAATPSPTPTATSTPTPTATPTATAAPLPAVIRISEVRSLVIEPPPLNFLANFAGMRDLSTNLAVVGTNLSLALLTLLVVLVAATIFNATIKENAEAISGGVTRFSAPVAGALGIAAAYSSRVDPFWSRHPLTFSAVKLVSLLSLTALVYATLDPHFGLNDASLVLVVGLMAGLTLTTFLYEGGQVVFSTRAFGLPGAIRAYPIALVIAAASVLLSRLIELNPGVIFGFVAGAALAGGGIGRREEGLIVFVPMLGVLGVSVAALALVDPLRSFSESHPGAWSSLPETAAVAVFVGGAESVLLSLIPLTFNDGQKVWTWNRYAWAVLALPASFLFFHVIVNRHESYGSLLGGANSGALLIALAFLAIAMATWLYFRLRNSGWTV